MSQISLLFFWQTIQTATTACGCDRSPAHHQLQDLPGSCWTLSLSEGPNQRQPCYTQQTTTTPSSQWHTTCGPSIQGRQSNQTPSPDVCWRTSWLGCDPVPVPDHHPIPAWSPPPSAVSMTSLESPHVVDRSHQFAYSANRSSEDAAATFLHAAVSHLVQQGSYPQIPIIEA